MIRKLRRASKRLRVTLWTLIVSPLIWTGHFLFCHRRAAARHQKGADTRPHLMASRPGYIPLPRPEFLAPAAHMVPTMTR